MQIEDLSRDVAGDMVDGNRDQISVLLLMVLGAIISELVHWFFQKYIDRQEAAEGFVKYYNNMGPLRRLRETLKVRAKIKRQQDVGLSSEKLTASLCNRFKVMTVADVLSLAD